MMLQARSSSGTYNIRFIKAPFPASALYTRYRDAFDKVFLCKEKQDDHRDRKNSRSRHQNAPLHIVLLQKSLQANVREDAWPQPGDRVLTLSTCYRGDNHQRYLVQGKLVAEAYAN